MMNYYKTTINALLALSMFCLYSCSKSSDNAASPGGSTSGTKTVTTTLPTVDTPETNFSLNTNATFVAGHDSIVSGGLVAYDGGASVTARGVCWSTSQNPTIADNKTVNGSGTGFFVSPFGHLTVNTTYYIRAYATNAIGTAYSSQQHLTTAYHVGEHSQGGYIYTIDKTTVHGLVVTLEDLDYSPWENTSNTYYLSAGAYNTSDGAGNTTKIIQTFGTSGNAAAVCRTCRDGGFTDWFLPAADQLNELTNDLYIEATPLPASNNYWSSTEWSSNIRFAYVIEGQYGALYGDNKVSMNSVRAIRAF